MSKPIIYIKVTFPINDPKNFKIETNAKPECVGDLIGDFLHMQIGQGRDDSQPDVDRKIYHIDLSVDLTDDTWHTSHDTGNKGLRDGILMHVFQEIVGRKGVIDWILRPTDETQKCKNQSNTSSSPTSEPQILSGSFGRSSSPK